MIPRIVQLLDVSPVVKHFAFCGVIEALNKLNYGRLAAARLAYESHDLVLFNFNRDALNHFHVTFGGIVELDIFKLHRTFSRRRNLTLICPLNNITLKENLVWCDYHLGDIVSGAKHFCNLLNVVCERASIHDNCTTVEEQCGYCANS